MSSRYAGIIAIVLLIVSVVGVGGCAPPTATTEPTGTVALPSATSTQTTLFIPLPGPEETPTRTTFVSPVLPSPTALPTDITFLSPVGPTPTSTPAPLVLRDWPAIALPDWPRPAGDNGRCMHFLRTAYYEDEELDRNIARLQDLGCKWCLVIYADEIQLERAATRFKAAGIMVVWRKMLRPYKHYNNWERDIRILQEMGLPPYMQLYNEPSLDEEWDGRSIDQEFFLENLMQGCRDVYNAGGYVGLQFVNDRWLRDALQALRERGGERIFGRMFFVPHPYALNHPPDYTGDENAVLGFRHYAAIFEEEIGFIPPMIAGEGGWKYGATDDPHFPRIDDELHRDYHVAVFDWFRTGRLSDGQPLPDYLFAFCPWLLAAPLEDSAWYDSFAGDHVLTIEAVKAIPPFERKFSWGR